MSHTPSATYRLQLHKDFTLEHANELIEYFFELGISHCYTSPLFTACADSTHCYDVIDFHCFNKQIGSEKSFFAFSKMLTEKGMGVLLDFVPNHMCVASYQNSWWNDVLENGQDSEYADFFDIDWHFGKILLPFLANPLKTELENKEIQLNQENGVYYFSYKNSRFPINPKTLTDNPDSFTQLETLLDKQAYKLTYWKDIGDNINYRRFFDQSQYGSLKIENPKVFQAVHKLVLPYVQSGYVQGLRIDHIDGLYEPEEYLKELRNQIKQHCYIVVEKILSGQEKLRKSWPVEGTTGYDFLNLVNSVFIYKDNKQIFYKLYESFTGVIVNFPEMVYLSKKLVLSTTMVSELNALTRLLKDVVKDLSFNFTEQTIKEALKEVISCFPVYRSYISENHPIINSHDKSDINIAVNLAKKKNSSKTELILCLDFIQNTLLLRYPDKQHHFTMKFQQITGPVMAKGFEDTALYRMYPLASINEVGSDLSQFGISTAEFHSLNSEKQKNWPLSQLATSTHDTKRSEDVRARINVLSEIPEQWEEHIQKWKTLNQNKKRKINNKEAPDPNEEYLLYQTIVGSFPLSDINLKTYSQRIKNYMIKALKEAKINTSWIDPQEDYQNAVEEFIDKILDDSSKNPFLDDLKSFIPEITSAGMLNSLSQILLKMSCPGIPDFYQGSEFWDYSLVDPDNRQPVNFEMRKRTLGHILKEKNDPIKLITRLMQNYKTGELKQYLIHKTLQFRKKYANLFTQGDYIPIKCNGPKENHIIAFARSYEDQTAIIAVSRFFMSLKRENLKINENEWKDTYLILPNQQKSYENILTGESFTFKNEVPLNLLFKFLPQISLISKR